MGDESHDLRPAPVDKRCIYPDIMPKHQFQLKKKIGAAVSIIILILLGAAYPDVPTTLSTSPR
tara:strand:+ start:61 stop:249 length:189 start_codon:yes stop_codon:yes gene_type:complete